jgi:hypothetical protein
MRLIGLHEAMAVEACSITSLLVRRVARPTGRKDPLTPRIRWGASHELNAAESRSSPHQGGDLPWGLSVCTSINVLPHVGQRGRARASGGSMGYRW